MAHHIRMLMLFAAGIGATLTSCSATPQARDRLPASRTFIGQDRFFDLVKRAEREKWRALPLGQRTMAVGLALVGTPYKNYTLEIDDHIEAPSANLMALDCWTFYEISLAFARMLSAKAPPYSPRDLLALIEIERYRNGVCNGSYLSRIHFLEELYYDNERRGLLRNISRTLGGSRMDYRRITEMTVAWKSYRYLRSNPGLLDGMDRIQGAASRLPVYHVPKRSVPSAEAGIQTGDIVSITTNSPGGYTTHVGLAYRDRSGTLRFVHASSRARKVIVDERLSRYLNERRYRAGVMIGRPLEVPPSIAARLFGDALASR